MEAKKHVYITVNGREVEYQAISLDALMMSKRGLERSFRERGEPIDPPTYEMVTGGGAKIREPHDAKTEKTPEEQAAWEAYLEARGRMDAENTKLTMRYILDDGLSQIILPIDGSWQEKYKARYIDVPTDLVELRDFYITTEVLPTKADITAITTSILLLSEQGKVDPDALEARLELFRGRVGRKVAKRPDSSQKQVEAQPEADGT